jgi:hypothetical protein
MQKGDSHNPTKMQRMEITAKELAKKQYTKRRVIHSTGCNHVPVEHGGDAGLSDGDGLLLHGFVDRYPVLVPHLIELRGRVGRERREENKRKYEVR